MDADLATLCRSCGLCCDGSLFGRVTLTRTEVAAAKRHRLHIVASGRAFEQPCTALATRGGGAEAERVCVAYDERPGACRRFECRLYARHRREGGPLAPRLESVRRTRELLAWLAAQPVSPDAGDERRPDTERAEYVELVKRLEDDFARA